MIERIDLVKNNMSLNRCAFHVRRLCMKDMYSGESLKNPSLRWLEVQQFDFIDAKHEENEFPNRMTGHDILGYVTKPHSICHDE